MVWRRVVSTMEKTRSGSGRMAGFSGGSSSAERRGASVRRWGGPSCLPMGCRGSCQLAPCTTTGGAALDPESLPGGRSSCHGKDAPAADSAAHQPPLSSAAVGWSARIARAWYPWRSDRGGAWQPRSAVAHHGLGHLSELPEAPPSRARAPDVLEPRLPAQGLLAARRFGHAVADAQGCEDLERALCTFGQADADRRGAQLAYRDERGLGHCAFR